MPKPPETNDEALVAEKLARFISSRGGFLPAALMSEFYAKHPDTQALLGGGKGKLHQLCCDHPEQLQFSKKSSGDTVELAPGWKARPLPHLPCITLCNLVSVLHEKGELSTHNLGRLNADERKAIAHCRGLEPLAYSYPELFRLSMLATGQDWALRFSLRLQNLWEILSGSLSSVGKAECGHIIGQLYKEDDQLRGVVQTLGGAAGLAQAFRSAIELQRREKEPGVEQQLFVWRRAKKSGSAAVHERSMKRTTPAGLPVEGDDTQKEAICCFWLQGSCKESASHKFLNVLFLHEMKPGLFCANGATCSRHGLPGSVSSFGDDCKLKFQCPFVTAAGGVAMAGSHTKEEKDREPTVTAAAPAPEWSPPGKSRTLRWGPSSAAAAAPARPGVTAGQAQDSTTAWATQGAPAAQAENAPQAQAGHEAQAAQADQGLLGVSRERRTLERLSARLIGARDLARRGALEAWEEELEEVSASLAEVCDRLAAREEDMQRREAALAQQGSGGRLSGVGSPPPLDTGSTGIGGDAAAVTASGSPGGEGSGAPGLSGGSPPPLDTSSTSTDEDAVAVTASGSPGGKVEASGSGRSPKQDGADSSSEFDSWERFIDPDSRRVWWWNAHIGKAKWEEDELDVNPLFVSPGNA